MGRISMPVDIFEILALAWDHPLIAGLLMLMFTPPFFPVLVFFSPLLISTTLCAVALISMGQQFEDTSKREREVTGWNARGAADGDLPAVRERTVRRRRVPGEDNWLDWVRGSLEPGSMWGQTENSMFIEDVKEERLLADFRVDEGGIDMKEEDLLQQIEAFREFEERNLGERSFSFRTGAAVAATIDALESPESDSSMSMIPFQNSSTHVQSPSPRIPSMFLYTLRTGGTGSGRGNGLGNISEAASGEQRPEPRQQQQQLQGGHHHQEQPKQQKTLVSFGSGFFSGTFVEPENDNQWQPQTRPQQQQKSLISVDSRFFPDSAGEQKRDNEQQQKQLVSLGNGYNSSSAVETLHIKDNQGQQQQGELISSGSGFIAGRFEEQENVNHQLRHLRSTSPDIHVSSAEPAHSSQSLARSRSSSQNQIRSSYVDYRESDHRKTSTSDFGGDRVDSRDNKPRNSQERSKALSYNASLIHGNAVIYSAEPPPVDPRQLQRRNSLSNRERRGSSTTSRHKRKQGMATRHALLMEKENNVSGNWLTTTTKAAS